MRLKLGLTHTWLDITFTAVRITITITIEMIALCKEKLGSYLSVVQQSHKYLNHFNCRTNCLPVKTANCRMAIELPLNSA